MATEYFRQGSWRRGRGICSPQLNCIFIPIYQFANYAIEYNLQRLLTLNKPQQIWNNSFLTTCSTPFHNVDWLQTHQSREKYSFGQSIVWFFSFLIQLWRRCHSTFDLLQSLGVDLARVAGQYPHALRSDVAKSSHQLRFIFECGFFWPKCYFFVRPSLLCLFLLISILQIIWRIVIKFYKNKY